MHAAWQQVQCSPSDIISSKQQCKCLVINNSFIIFGSCIMLKSLLFYYRQKTLSMRFRIEVNQKFMEENDNNLPWHVLLWQAEWNLGFNKLL